jgi:hypothetical protein
MMKLDPKELRVEIVRAGVFRGEHIYRITYLSYMICEEGESKEAVLKSLEEKVLDCKNEQALGDWEL